MAVRTRRMKPDTIAILKLANNHYKLATEGDGTATEKDDASWFRPRDLGGTRNSPVGSQITRLVIAGLIEKQDITRPGSWRELKVWRYRITPAGREEIAELERAP